MRALFGMEETTQRWTQEERQKLFDDYFGPSPGICAVCGQEVSIVMSHLGRTVTLLLTCDGCRNKASVSRALPVGGCIEREQVVQRSPNP